MGVGPLPGAAGTAALDEAVKQRVAAAMIDHVAEHHPQGQPQADLQRNEISAQQNCGSFGLSLESSLNSMPAGNSHTSHS